jgi:hypothetical protein
MSERLYDNIVSVLEDYLGPAAGRFVDRQIAYHFDKPPQEVTTSDLERLTDWIRISMSLLTDDAKIVEECVYKLGLLI